MIIFILGFLSSLIFNYLLIRTLKFHITFSGCNQVNAPQRFHETPISRIGGAGIFFGLCIAATYYKFNNPTDKTPFEIAIACSAPFFIVGLIEDITKNVGVLTRLMVTAFGALAVIYLLKIQIKSIDIHWVDYLLSFSLLSIIFTCFAITGMVNAFNIIDGLNGLSSMVGIISLLAISYVSYRVGDLSLVIMSFTMIGSILGFLIWNYPLGLIFLGDGGAYLIGYWIATMSILIIARNPGISPWFPVMINIYPIFETLFSIWRRKINQGKNPGIRDAEHLHSLIYLGLLKKQNIKTEMFVAAKNSNDLNSRASRHLWILTSMAALPGFFWWDRTWILQLSCVIFCIGYYYLYKSIINFIAPEDVKNIL